MDRPDREPRDAAPEARARQAIDAALAAAGHNLRLLRAWLIRLLAFILSLIAISGPEAKLPPPPLAAR
jgi:hypothetical protein